MDGQWVIERDFDAIVAGISSFHYPEVELDVLPLERELDHAIFACYVPTRPRPTSVIVGEIRVRRLAGNRAEIRMTRFPAWAAPFIRSLVTTLGASP